MEVKLDGQQPSVQLCIWTLTWILGIMLSIVEDFKGTSEVKSSEIREESEEDLDNLLRSISVLSDCTHLEQYCSVKWYLHR